MTKNIINDNLPVKSFQKWLDEKIDEIKNNEYIPPLLLHSCCAPCSSYVLEYLSTFFSITVFFYNPNIHPEEEYKKRLAEQASLITRLKVKNRVNLLPGLYEPEIFFQKTKGLEEEKEGKRRCVNCFRLRLEQTAQKAYELGFPYFTTTLTVSPYKNAQLINLIGNRVASLYELQYLFSDFKKKGGFQRSIELSRQYQLYRQNYCGCIFSKNNSKTI